MEKTRGRGTNLVHVWEVVKNGYFTVRLAIRVGGGGGGLVSNFDPSFSLNFDYLLLLKLHFISM